MEFQKEVGKELTTKRPVSNEGLEIFPTSVERPLNPFKLAQRFAATRARTMDGSTEVSTVADEGLLADQIRHINPAIPIKILVLGAGGHLADFRLAKGVRELEGYMAGLGGAGKVSYTLCDVFDASSNEALKLVERRQSVSGYNLNAECPYLSKNELTAARLGSLGFSFCIGATPPNVHAADAERAVRLGLHTYIEKPAYLAGLGEAARTPIAQAVATKRVDLLDFFLYNRAFLDFASSPEHYFSGKAAGANYDFGAVQFLHSTCLEPHSVDSEGPRRDMLMNFDAQGGFLWADQGPHPQALMNAVLRSLFDRSIAESEIAMTYRSRDTSVAGPRDAETSAAVLRLLDLGNAESGSGRRVIELLGVVGKGLQVPGGQSDRAAVTYMLTIGCERGQIDICIGDGMGTVPSYIAYSPLDANQPKHLLKYENSGLGYALFLADAVIAGQSRVSGTEAPATVAARLNRQTESSLEAMQTIEDVYGRWNRSSENIQRYGPDGTGAEPVMPAELPLASQVHGAIDNRRVN